MDVRVRLVELFYYYVLYYVPFSLAFFYRAEPPFREIFTNLFTLK
ncbi:hypothetical protein HNQ92_001393 [Rhabdobacter roseus]|uniref:Uncharacterized protein n=1 Tax=Rhabdobacter roseus TaxID=1655419 RepID=A0A840TND0_9BACT|nr:hypothetical protein [Rhabdobacter roseus]